MNRLWKLFKDEVKASNRHNVFNSACAAVRQACALHIISEENSEFAIQQLVNRYNSKNKTGV